MLLQYDGVDLKVASDLKTVPAEAGARSIPVQYWRRGEVRSAVFAAGKLGITYQPGRKAAEVILARPADQVLKPLTRSTTLERLPGTRLEVDAIAAPVPERSSNHSDRRRGHRVGLPAAGPDGRSKDLSVPAPGDARRGQRGRRQTPAHCLPRPDPDRSADPTALDTDGRITAQQIVNTWDLDADLVVLSACESGLGRFAGGEGYVGFTQRFLSKGRNCMV